jgi:homoserine O-acetyltransferase/O-succinyltransferase
MRPGIRVRFVVRLGLALAATLVLCTALATPAPPTPPREGDAVFRNVRFGSGETLPELELHYLTLGRLQRDAQGHALNAVLILHGTGGSGRQFLVPQFAGELYGAGQPLDTTRYLIVLPDGIGHGRSSKPSDGLHARFPHYDYDDMVAAQHRLLTEHLGVDHLRLVMGTSMGGMHTWVWGETYPDFMDALMPLACNTVAIVGRNRLWRQMIVDAIRSDPEWKEGEYTTEPLMALRAAENLLIIAGSAPILMQNTLATRDSVDHWLAARMARDLATLDANDLLYQVEASRHYDPSGRLSEIRAPVTWVNSADDFINPPELGIAQRQAIEVRGSRFVLLPASDETHGHGTHTWAALWKDDLLDLLQRSEARR